MAEQALPQPPVAVDPEPVAEDNAAPQVAELNEAQQVFFVFSVIFVFLFIGYSSLWWLA